MRRADKRMKLLPKPSDDGRPVAGEEAGLSADAVLAIVGRTVGSARGRSGARHRAVEEAEDGSHERKAESSVDWSTHRRHSVTPLPGGQRLKSIVSTTVRAQSLAVYRTCPMRLQSPAAYISLAGSQRLKAQKTRTIHCRVDRKHDGLAGSRILSRSRLDADAAFEPAKESANHTTIPPHRTSSTD